MTLGRGEWDALESCDWRGTLSVLRLDVVVDHRLEHLLRYRAAQENGVVEPADVEAGSQRRSRFFPQPEDRQVVQGVRTNLPGPDAIALDLCPLPCNR